MKYIYDSETDSLAIILADRRAAGSEEVWPGVIVDFDEAGRPVAFDFSSASESIDVPVSPTARRCASPILTG